MAMTVKNNLSANNTLNKVDKNSKELAKSTKKLSSGMRINSAADDASGYSITEQMRVQIRALEQSNSNTQTGSSMLKTAEGAVGSTVEILRTLKEKVINAANDSNTDDDRKTIQKELDESIDQINDNANVTYNNKWLVDGSKSGYVKEPGTWTCLTNDSFAEDVTLDTDLTKLKSAAGDNLGIETSDTLVVSYVKQGTTHTITFHPLADSGGQVMKLREVFSGHADDGRDVTQDLVVYDGKDTGQTDPNGDPIYDRTHIGTNDSGADVYTPSGRSAITFKAVQEGLDGQISGLTFCFTSVEGNIRKSANATADNFTEMIRAKDPSPDNSIVLHTNVKANQAVKVGLTDMRSYALGLSDKEGIAINISTQPMANAAISVLDNALKKALDQQTDIGSILNRLEYTSSNLVVSDENTQASESTIRDADMAQEMTEYTKNNVLLQASQSMLAQANQNSSAVLSLLQ